MRWPRALAGATAVAASACLVAVGWGAWRASLWEPERPASALVDATADLPVRVERWLELPLTFTNVYDARLMREFVENEDRLRTELTALAEGSPPLPAAREALAPLEKAGADGLLVTQATRAEAEAVARAYLASSDVAREAVSRVADEAAVLAGTAETEERARRRTGALVACVGVLGLVVTGLAATVWAYARVRRWSGEVVAVADPAAAGERSLEEVDVAVRDLARRLADQRSTTERQIRAQDMLREFTEALETTDEESDLVHLFLRAMRMRHPRLECQLLLSDPSEEELLPVDHRTEARGVCDPQKPGRCKAMRLGRALRVDDPASIAACPRMQPAGCAAYGCVPLTIAGRSAAVLRMTANDDPITTPEILDASTVAQRFAVRLGVQRLLQTTARQAASDPLTGLPNRRVTLDGLQRLLRGGSAGGCVAVLGLDLDHFKKLNDTHGHAGGDAALRSFVATVRGVLPPDAIFGRVGGEEFLVAAPTPGRAGALQLAAEVVRAVRATTRRGGDTPATTVSIGIALAPDDGHDVTELMGIADQRLYLAKNGGRDRAVGPGGEVAGLDGPVLAAK
ncbi:MAG: diguanylate cyclase domain-containing protein [Myxococcota bacterium]